MVRRYKRSLHKLQDPGLPPGKDALGPFGLFMFLWGILDVVIDAGLCITLKSCGQVTLLYCCLVTLVTTTLLTWYLGYTTLRAIVLADDREGRPAQKWLLKNPLLGPMIVLASSSRLNSMAILRLRLCGRMMVDFPDSEGHRYFHFMRNCGLYHFWVEDIPHVLISLALLYSADDEGFQACQASGHSKVIHPFGHKLELPFGDTDIAWASLSISLGSIVFGMISKAMQLLTVSLAAPPVSVELATPTDPSAMAELLQRLRSSTFDGTESIRSLARRVTESSDGEEYLAT
eukprot:COSAG01_NODE_10491_length_2152_cov_3.265465_2_plen_289_part_00